MVQKAVVKKILNSRLAEIEVQRQTACGHDCSKCSGCGTPTEFVKAVAVNSVSAKVGNIVSVEGSSQVIMRYATIVYVLPLILFFVLYALGAILSLGEGLSAIIGICGFVAGILYALWHNKKLKKSGEIIFEITKIG